MVLPSKREIEITAQVLGMGQGEAADLRAFYDRERRAELRRKALRLGWRILKGILMCIGVLAILAVCALLWLIPGGLP